MTESDRYSHFLYDVVMRKILTGPLRFLFGCEVLGKENLPKNGPAILASSHSSNLDPLLLCVSYPGTIRWMAKAELWRIPLLGGFLELTGCFKVHRGEADREAIRSARRLLGDGWVIGIFPEGRRYRGSELGEFLPGVGMLAHRSAAAVIPVRIRGSNQIGLKMFFHRPRVRLIVGQPVDTRASGSGAAQEITRRIRDAVDAL